MTNREYNIRRNTAYKAHREVTEALEKFAKRSKNITYIRDDSYWGLCRIDLSVSKDGKVVREMMEYLKVLCSYYEPANFNEEYPSAWFRNYDDCAIDENEDGWDVQFEICVNYY